MAKTSKKPAPTPTFKKWRVYAGDSQTDIEAPFVEIQDGILVFMNANAVIAAWNQWSYVTLLVPSEPET